jgi:hypothetical protein
MNLLLGIPMLIVVSVAYIVLLVTSKQNWQFALAIAAYLFLILSVFGMHSNKNDQVTKLENVISDYMECWDKSETWDDTATCYLLLDSDVTLYVREYK